MVQVVGRRKLNEESKVDEELRSLILENVLQAFEKIGFEVTYESSGMVS